MNPSPNDLPYRVQILNNKAEQVIRENFAKAICQTVAGTSQDMLAEVLMKAGQLAMEREQEYIQAMAQHGVKILQF